MAIPFFAIKSLVFGKNNYVNNWINKETIRQFRIFFSPEFGVKIHTRQTYIRLIDSRHSKIFCLKTKTKNIFFIQYEYKETYN